MHTATRARQHRGYASGRGFTSLFFGRSATTQPAMENARKRIEDSRFFARNAKPGQVVSYVRFAHGEGPLAFMNSRKVMRVVSDGTARGKLDAAHEKLREMGVKPGTLPFILDVPAGKKGQGSFRGADLRGVAISGTMPDIRGAYTRGAVFYKAAGALVASGNDLSNASFNQSSADGSQLAWANMNGLRVSGGSTGINIDAPNAMMGALFNYTSGNLGQATIVPVVPGSVAKNYVSFCGAKNLKMTDSGIQLGPRPAIVTPEDRSSLAKLAGEGRLDAVLHHGLPKKFAAPDNDNGAFQSHVRPKRLEEVPAHRPNYPALQAA